jgi:Domain of unknown function (DUF4157)
MSMSRDKTGKPEQEQSLSQGSGAERNVAPGKVTRSSRLPSGSTPSVQRKASSSGADPGGGSQPARARSSSELTADPGMDAAHRGQGAVQAKGAVAEDTGAVHEAAARGISEGGGSLPFMDRIQASFGGAHDVGGIQAHTGGAAAAASADMGASAYASGEHVAFAGAPDLHTAAHEAAHVVQQRSGVSLSGGVGQVGDSYERQADAVADRVVAGESAGDLLGGAIGSSAAGGVQRQVQLSIKEDLRKAVDGWGTDEGAIYARLQRATVAELREVMADRALMAALRGDLNQSEMSRVLDMLQAPLADKLRLAIAGWGTDEGYIHRSLARASQAELAAIAADPALLAALEGDLSGEDLRRVLDRLSVPLDRKLRFAIRGWGTDEQYIFDSIAGAPIAQVMTVARDGALMQALDDDLNATEQAFVRGSMARRINTEGASPDLAFSLLMASADDARAARLAQFGGVAEQRALCDVVIAAGTNLDRVVQAFEAYWNVDTSVAAGAGAWGIPELQRVHAECKRLPEQDVRSGKWTTLLHIQGTGAHMSSGGEFGLGDGAAGAPRQPYGVLTELSAPAAAGDTTIQVKDPAVFATGDSVAMAARPSADVHAITAVAGQTYTLDAALTQAYPATTRVVPDDQTAARDVDWLEAAVRHEIAHAVDNAVGASGFYALGGWWSGNDFDSWANQMGSPWATNDGSTISDEDKKAIKDAIMAAKGTDGKRALNRTVAADHAISRYWGKGVPVIEAANASISRGQAYWQNPEVVPSYNGKRFAVNLYYHTFQSYNEEVHASRVRSYAVFSPAEFFAEVYTVYYEEAGRVPDGDLGRLIPVSGWRDWIKSNVHERGQAPTATSPTGGGVGAKAMNPGM